MLIWLAHATVMDNRELKTNRHEVKIEFLLTLAAALPLVWLVTVRLQLSKHGLRYASLSGSKEMRWRDVSLLFVSWRQRYLARILPIYRAYRVEIVDRQGTRLVFGNRFQGSPRSPNGWARSPPSRSLPSSWPTSGPGGRSSSALSP